jgi:diaminopimelate decarboxylase
MDHFTFRNGLLHVENIGLDAIADAVGTPAYVYSRAALTEQYQAFTSALADVPHQICFAVKANSNLAVLNVLARLGAGFDIVSGGELERVLRAGGQPDRIVFSGVGKTATEMQRALSVGIHCFNIESAAELEALDAIARDLGCKAPIAIRVNPDVDAETHPYISTGLRENKFGVDVETAVELYLAASQLAHVEIRGIGFHIGSQLTRLEPLTNALERVLDLAARLEAHGITLTHLDVGGGLGVRYRDEEPPSPAEYVAALLRTLGPRRYRILLEPGRAISANAGVLLTRVLYLKHSEERDFAIVDGAMNDLLRPSLYGAWQEIVPVLRRERAERLYDVVGPVCETGDFLGKQRSLGISAGDLLAIRSSGAYGYVMGGNYNSRPRPPEVMVDGDRFFVVNRRESIDQLMARETLLPEDPV